MRKSVAEREAELRSQPVAYHENGQVRFPVTYTQLLRECQQIHRQLTKAQSMLRDIVKGNWCITDVQEFLGDINRATKQEDGHER